MADPRSERCATDPRGAGSDARRDGTRRDRSAERGARSAVAGCGVRNATDPRSAGRAARHSEAGRDEPVGRATRGAGRRIARDVASRGAPRHAIRRVVRHRRPHDPACRARNQPGNGQQTAFWHGIGLPTKRTPHRLHQKPRSLRFAIHASPPKHPSACQNAVSWPKSDRIYVRPELTEASQLAERSPVGAARGNPIDLAYANGGLTERTRFHGRKSPKSEG